MTLAYYRVIRAVTLVFISHLRTERMAETKIKIETPISVMNVPDETDCCIPVGKASHGHMTQQEISFLLIIPACAALFRTHASHINRPRLFHKKGELFTLINPLIPTISMVTVPAISF